MTLSKVLVSVLILAISTHTSLHSWSRITATSQRQTSLEQALLQAEQQLLAARRLLRRSPAAGCALSPEHLDQQLAPFLPQTPGLLRSWQQDPLAGASMNRGFTLMELLVTTAVLWPKRCSCGVCRAARWPCCSWIWPRPAPGRCLPLWIQPGPAPSVNGNRCLPSPRRTAPLQWCTAWERLHPACGAALC